MQALVLRNDPAYLDAALGQAKGAFVERGCTQAGRASQHCAWVSA